MYTNNKLSKAVRLAIAFGAVSATAFTAAVNAAEEDAAAKVERIEVTGSRLKRTDMEGALPVTVIDHWPLRSPVSGCRKKPGRSISLISLAKSSTTSRLLNFLACFGSIPAVEPVSKYFFNPLCLKLLIIKSLALSGVALYAA